MKVAFVCLLAAAAVAGAAAAGEFNFFPGSGLKAAAEGAEAPLTAFPAPWTFESQTKYAELGNEGEGLLKIAVEDYFPKGPTLYVVPGAWCDTPGAAVAGPAPSGLVAKAGAVVPESAPAEAPAAEEQPAAEEAAPAAEEAAPATAEAVPAEAEAAPNAANAAPNAANAAPGARRMRKLMQDVAPGEVPAGAEGEPVDTAAAAEPTPEEAAQAAAEEAAASDEAAAAEAEPAADEITPESAPSNDDALFTVDAVCTPLAENPVSFRVNGGEEKVPEKVVVDGVEAWRVELEPNMPDGPICIEISASYDTGAVSTTPSYTDLFEPLAPTTTFKRTVCLHKLTRQADAKLDYDMCINNKLTLNISDITPLPVNLTLDNAPMDASLFRPLVKVYGGKVAELDGTPTEPRNYDEVASRNQYNWVARYFPISPSYEGGELSFVLSDTLQEGYYEVNSVVSVVTAYPNLTSLAGLTQITQDDVSGAEVKGMWEAAARQIHTKTIVGVQKGSTPTTLSAISSASHAPGQQVLPGQQVVLTWQFRGVGSATCLHDGQPVSNAADGKCVSPLTIEARDVSADDTTHSVAVAFADVCGGEKKAEFEYTQAGVRPLTATEVVNSDGSIEMIMAAAPSGATLNATVASVVKSGARAAAAATAAAGAAAVAVAAMLL
ncbi:hypothetical protein Rsub_08493 [Raphidocelis subcapitata]|uniref:Uncharacterized protein n=1 Tax=Raphidocelis subcapitata TaxID=307507 RepID=A0A2V0PAC4_9CHLO|nr:hypothetical protein Rsub_08493 [Raphidocelis subcapitata]|eukprot:GBF95902.1 hypothetical protein Rsub_08493 [Raphidocelis subcapitata]